jgi:hypothetical protein
MFMDRILSDYDIEHFIDLGHVRVKECFSREVAREWSDRAFVRLGYDREDRATWKESRIHMPCSSEVRMEEFSPKLWRAVCELLGGENRVQPSFIWDSFVVNLCDGSDRVWEPPSASVLGWHKDGDSFRHFLDSPEEALLPIIIWTDIVPRGGGTFIACDSIGVVARLLAEHPEGVLPEEFNFDRVTRQCKDFLEISGDAGDVVLMHPFMLHASSQNHSMTPRIITNPPIQLKEPMNFNREDRNEYSPVERAVLISLGVERFDFRPTRPRECFVPERANIEKQMLEKERERLASLL